MVDALTVLDAIQYAALLVVAGSRD